MFGRPRCREWTPLTTQQLRLRSLIQIVGYNIRPPEYCTYQCSYYLTLHHTTMSAPFYTSEKISSPHPKWKEIDSEITQRMSSTNVVIRIWCHIVSPSSEISDQNQDTIIQTWGVYFSGLRYIGANLALNFNSDCFKSNTLVFQMHGGYFCSYKSLKLDIIPPENELEQGSISSESSDRSKDKNLIIRSLSPGYKKDKEYSKSHSPIERNLRQFSQLRASSSLNIRKRDSSENSYESPDLVKEFRTSEQNCDINSDSSKIDLSETAESYDLRNETDGVPKYRYMALSFLKSEIRPSYNATKLQSLHLLQYAIKKKQEAVQEIKERIYKKSALSDSIEPECEVKLKNKSRSQRNLFSPVEETKEKSSSINDLSKNGKVREDRTISNGPRLTLKLNDLLSYKSKPSPFQRAEHVRLTKQLEILHFKRLILSDERDSKLVNIRRLKERHAKLFEENQDVGSELMTNYHALSRRNESLKELRENCAALRECAARNHAALCNCRSELLLQLQKIFYIQQKDATTWTIIDVPLPICGDDTRASNPVPDSVAAGYVAQATVLTAAILNQPLRYKITLLGSASKILDITPDLPDPNIPLFAKGGDVTLFRYAMFLLNKCIAQLLWGRGLAVHDMRPTLANLQRLLITPCNLSDTSKLFGTYRWLAEGDSTRTQSLRSLVASDRGKYSRQFNRFKECVDGQSSHKTKALHRHKLSKSDGSCYQEDHDLNLDSSSTSIMGSESNLYNLKLSETDNFKTQSNPEISSINSVVFIIGDDEKLLKMSSNNDDVTEICSAINDFCAKDVDTCAINVDTCAKDVDTCAKDVDTCEKDVDTCAKDVETCAKDIENCCAIDVENCSNDFENCCAEIIESFFAKDTENRCVETENCSGNGIENCNTNDIPTCCSKDLQNSSLVIENCSKVANCCVKDLENFDVVKHLSNETDTNICSTSDIEDLCAKCDRNGELCSLECANNVEEVIVIPSAEAIIEN